jgi:hypothetical protein
VTAELIRKWSEKVRGREPSQDSHFLRPGLGYNGDRFNDREKFRDGEAGRGKMERSCYWLLLI